MIPPGVQVATRNEVAPAKGNNGRMSRQESLARSARAASRQGRVVPLIHSFTRSNGMAGFNCGGIKDVLCSERSHIGSVMSRV